MWLVRGVAYEGAVASTAVCRVALLGMVLVLIVIAYFPFAWSPPRIVRNQVTRSADGSLQFGEMNYARTPGTPAWLQYARASGIIQIQLQAYPQSLQQNAAIMMLASDSWHTDFAIGQDHSNLMVWLRRPGSDINGDPPFVIHGVLQPQRWNSVAVILQRGAFRIDVDDKTRLTEHLRDGFLAGAARRSSHGARPVGWPAQQADRSTWGQPRCPGHALYHSAARAWTSSLHALAY